MAALLLRTSTDGQRFWRSVLGPALPRIRKLWSGLTLPRVLLGLCACFALRALLFHGLTPLNFYDEALLLNNARLMNQGQVIYRDFSSNYPPGIFQLVRVILALGLPAIWTLRLVGLLVRIASALLAARLVGKVRGTGFCAVTGVTVLVLQTELGLTAFAYPIAVLLLMGVADRWPSPGAARRHWFVCGAMFGLLSYLRHDLFVYACAGLLLLEGLSWAVQRRSWVFGARSELTDLAGIALATTLGLWLPYLALAGVSRVLHDVVLDVSRLAMPARVLPIPPLFVPFPVDALDMTLPALFAERTRLSLLFAAVAVIAGALLLLKRLRSDEGPSPSSRLLLLLTVFACATLPQALGRTDYFHVAFGLPLVLALLGSALGRRVSYVVLLMALVPWFAERLRFIDGPGFARLWQVRTDAAFMTEERKTLTALIQAHVPPGEPLFVGCASHQLHNANTLDLYYFADRPGATRYMQFDPGLTTSLGAQTEMVADLERTRPKLFVRYRGCYWPEPNASGVLGATLLDDYLNGHYAPLQSSTNFDVLARKGVSR